MSGRLWGVLRWGDLNALFAAMRARRGWYASMPGEALPDAPLAPDALDRALAELGELLRREHRHDYCGIVYADDAADPALVKVYDPGNLGTSCGSGGGGHPPRWVFSLDRPEPLEDAPPVPAARRRWWQGLFDTGRS